MKPKDPDSGFAPLGENDDPVMVEVDAVLVLNKIGELMDELYELAHFFLRRGIQKDMHFTERFPEFRPTHWRVAMLNNGDD